MTDTPLPDVIAERELEVGDDPPRKVMVRVGRPVQQPTGEWACPFQIEGLWSKHTRRAAYGEDSLQALQLGLEMLRITIRSPGLRLDGEEVAGAGIYPIIMLPPEYAAPVEEALERASEAWRAVRDAEDEADR